MARILNVGCGDDTYGTHFVDLYPSRKEVVKCNIDAEKLPFRSNYFDVVYSKNLLEHLTNPGFALKEMHRVLKNGGHLSSITDNAHYWAWTFLKEHALKYDVIKKGVEDKHYMLFELPHLRNLAESAGFKKCNLTYYKEPISMNTIKDVIRFFSNLLFRVLNRRMSYRRVRLEAIKLD